ncbi:hypothetical protein ABPG75_005491 [Micractinium tetrahymenae]
MAAASPHDKGTAAAHLAAQWQQPGHAVHASAALGQAFGLLVRPCPCRGRSAPAGSGCHKRRHMLPASLGLRANAFLACGTCGVRSIFRTSHAPVLRLHTDWSACLSPVPLALPSSARPSSRFFRLLML